jgi:hypothetical protein
MLADLRVGIKKPAQKNPQKTLLKKNKKNPQVVFFFFFFKGHCFIKKFAVFPFKRPLYHN